MAIPFTQCIRSARTLLGALGLLACLALPPAQAQLQGLVLDQTNQQSYLATLDASNASLVPIAGSLAAIAVAPAAVTANPITGQVFAIGPASDGNLQLIRFNADGSGAQVVGNSGSPARAVALHFDFSNQRLIGLVNQSGLLNLVSIDPGTAALTTIHSGASDCCVLDGGGSALLGDRVYVSGRLRTDSASTHRLLGFSMTGDNALSSPSLSITLGALAANYSDGQLYGLSLGSGALPRAPSLQLVRVGTDGSSVSLGSAGASCCAVDFDVATVSNNQLVALARPLGGGTQVLSADLGTGNFSFSSANLASATVINALYDLSAGLVTTTTTIDSIVPNPVVIGQSYLVSASVSAAMGSPTGTVLISDDLGQNCSFAAPSGSCSLNATMVGSRTITANFQGTGMFAGSSTTAPLQINSSASTTTITGTSPNPSAVGANYTVSVTVTGFSPTGTVTVSDDIGNSCPINLPSTSCSLNGTMAGTRSLSAQYSGDGNNQASSGSASHTVSLAVSSLSLGPVSPSPSTVGQSYIVNASVTGFGTPTGSISINDGQGNSCTISLPATSCSLNNSAAGNLTLSGSYSGDANNQPSSASIAHSVNRAASTTQILSLVPNPVRAGSAYSVNIQVTGFGTPGGMVNINDGLGATCQVTLPATSCSLVTNQAGMATITANYLGDTNNLPSSTTATQTVQASITSLAMSVMPNPPVQGQDVVMEAILSDAVEPLLRGVAGTISFRRNGVLIPGCEALVLNNTSASCSTHFDQAVSILLRADYSGDANNEPSFVELGVIVEPLPIPTLNALGLLALMLVLLACAWRPLRRMEKREQDA